MAEPLKNVYNESFFAEFTDALIKVIPDFHKDLFLRDIYDKEWKSRELKQRMYHISSVLHDHLPSDFEDAITLLKQLVGILKTEKEQMSFEYMFLPDYVEKHGLDDYEISVSAFEVITQFTSCEFAVRPFLVRYPEKMTKQMLRWSKHKESTVRRLASEGCRPRLPWAMALPAFKKDPEPILHILDNLKNDPSEFVRRSVANNLNDIAKDNPSIVVSIAKSWFGKTKETDALVKHACRTLLKEGNREIMELFGFGSVEEIEIKNFSITTPHVKIGEKLSFKFQLSNKLKSATKVRLEYGLYYQKANGSLSRKVFKISEKVYQGDSTTQINRDQPFYIITTRKYYKGLHRLSLIINGNEYDELLDFELLD